MLQQQQKTSIGPDVSVMYVVVCFPLAVLQYSDQKQFERERVYLAYRLGKVEARTEAETMKNSA